MRDATGALGRGALALLGSAAFAAGVHHGQEHLDFLPLGAGAVRRANHLARQQFPVLRVARWVHRGKLGADAFARRVPNGESVNQPLLHVRPDGVDLHLEAGVAAALHVHGGHDEARLIRHDIALQRGVLLLDASARRRFGQRAWQVRHALVGVGGCAQRFLHPGQRVLAQPLQVPQDQRPPLLVRRGRAAHPVARYGTGSGFAISGSIGGDFLPVAQPHAARVQLVFGLRPDHAAAVRTDDAVVLRRHRGQIGLPHQLQQFLVGW